MFPAALPLTVPPFQPSSSFTSRSQDGRTSETNPRKFRLCFSPYSSSPSPFDSPLMLPINSNPAEENIQRYVSGASERTTTTLPCARTFENDCVRLSLIGSVAFNQAITASAADGGQSAGEHIRANVPCMVIETVFPIPSHHHATVSTRLCVPSERVLEKGEKLRQQLTNEMLSSTSSHNIFTSTFRQVVMRKLWSFELTLFPAGIVRNMNYLEIPRNVEESIVITSSSDHAITMLAQSICAASLRNTEREFPSNSFIFKKDKIVSRDSSLTIEEAKENGVSMYRFTMNPDMNTRLVGWKKIGADKFQISLTHKQMESLSDVLDMFYEDAYTLPDKELLLVNLCSPMKYPHSVEISLIKLIAIGSVLFCLSFASFLRYPSIRASVQGFVNRTSEVEDVPNKEPVGEPEDYLKR